MLQVDAPNEEEELAMSPRKRVPGSQYSGKFLLRISPALHRALDEHARKEGISLNALCQRYLQEHVLQGQNSTADALRYVREAISQLLPMLDQEAKEQAKAKRAKVAAKAR